MYWFGFGDAAQRGRVSGRVVVEALGFHGLPLDVGDHDRLDPNAVLPPSEGDRQAARSDGVKAGIVRSFVVK